MNFEVHCMFILPTKLSLFNYDKVKSVLQSVTPLSLTEVREKNITPQLLLYSNQVIRISLAEVWKNATASETLHIFPLFLFVLLLGQTRGLLGPLRPIYASAFFEKRRRGNALCVLSVSPRRAFDGLTCTS